MLVLAVVATVVEEKTSLNTPVEGFIDVVAAHLGGYLVWAATVLHSCTTPVQGVLRVVQCRVLGPRRPPPGGSLTRSPEAVRVVSR